MALSKNRAKIIRAAHYDGVRYAIGDIVSIENVPESVLSHWLTRDKPRAVTVTELPKKTKKAAVDDGGRDE